MSAAQVSGAAAAPPATPFQFLDYYEEKDAERFAGRDREIDDIADAAGHAPTLIVYGKSGLGKTSLFLAGVFPELRRRDYLPIHVRTLKEPLREVLQEVRSALGRAGRAAPAPTGDVQAELLAALRVLAEPQPVVIVLDQFEEFFIRFRGQRDVYDGFAAAIGAIAAERGMRVHVVFSLREEFLADLDDFRAHVPALFENDYRLRPMTAFGVRQTILRPLEIAGVPVESRLIAKLVDRLAKERFDSVVLQILCQEVFDHAIARQSSDFVLTEADLEDAGNIDLVFRRYLDEMALALPKSRSLHAHVVLRRLTTEERTKRALRLQDFSTALYRLEDHEVLEVLKVLEAHRLLRVDTRGGEDWYELTHERLVPILEEWLRLDPEFNALLAAYDLIVTPSRSSVWRTAPQNLLSAGYLSDVVGPFRERLGLLEREVEFLVCSALYHRHPDIEFWSAQLGVERARDLIFQKLRDRSAEFRRGAAFSAARVSKGHEPTLATLLELALKDPELRVRREAGLALSQLRGNATDQQLGGALADKLTRRAALETLADLCAQKADVSGFSRWDRYLARRLARTRLLEEKKALLADASREGALGGLYGAILWSLIVVPPYALLLSFFLAGVGAGSKPGMFVLSLGIALFGAIALGALLTVFLARSVASRVLLSQNPNFARALWLSKSFWIVPAVWSTSVTLVYVLTMEGQRHAEQVLMLQLPAFYWVLVPLTVRFVQRASDSKDRFRSAARDALFAAAGLPVLVPWVIAAVTQRFFGGDLDYAELVVMFSLLAVPFWSGLCATISIGLLRMWLQHGPLLYSAPPPVARPRFAPWTRLFAPKPVRLLWLPLLSVVALSGVLVETGLGLIPMGRAAQTLGPSSQLVQYSLSQRGAGLLALDYEFFRVETPNRAPALVVFEKPDCVEFTGSARLDRTQLDDRKMELLLEAGEHELALSRFRPGIAEPGERCSPLRFRYVASVEEPAANPQPGGYFWLDWAPPVPGAATQRPAPDVPGALDSDDPNAKPPIVVRASMAGKTEANALVAVKAYAPIVQRDFGPSVYGTARCSSGEYATFRFGTRSNLHSASDKLSCIVRADREGAWKVEFELKIGSDLFLPGDRYRGMANWTALPPQLSAAVEGTLGEVDASFLDVSGTSLEGLSLNRARFLRARLVRASLKQSDLSHARAALADFSGADLSDAVLENADLPLSNLSGARLSGARFQGASLRRARLDAAIVGGRPGNWTDFTGADLSEASLLRLEIRNAVTFARARLSRANLAGLDLTHAVIDDADFSLADISGTRFSAEGPTAPTNKQIESACGQGEAFVGARRVPLKSCPPSIRYLGIFRDSFAFCATAPTSNLEAGQAACRQSVDLSRLDNLSLSEDDTQAAWTTFGAIGAVQCSCALDPPFRSLFPPAKTPPATSVP